jgi:hypothetical protein
MEQKDYLMREIEKIQLLVEFLLGKKLTPSDMEAYQELSEEEKGLVDQLFDPDAEIPEVFQKLDPEHTVKLINYLFSCAEQEAEENTELARSILHKIEYLAEQSSAMDMFYEIRRQDLKQRLDNR